MTEFRVVTTDAAPAGWDEYLAQRSSAHIYLRKAWVAFAAEVFGFHHYFLHATSPDGALIGVLPLVHQRSLLFGSRLVSLPFFNYGGPVANTPAIRAGLVTASAELARRLRIGVLELRDDSFNDAVSVRTDKATMLLDLPPTVEALSKQLGTKLRSQIKRAERLRPTVTIGGGELVASFFDVFAPTMRDLGTPVYPRRFFDSLMERCGADCRIVVVGTGERAVAAGLVVRHPNRLEIPWAASLREFRSESVNMRLYWEVLRYAVETGCPAFDFGRSSIDSGTYRFKLQWGAKPAQLYWEYPLESSAPPSAGQREGGVTRALQAVWTRLPTAVANRIGAVLSPGLPW